MLVLIGKITKPQGVRGEFRLYPLLGEINRYSEYQQLYINNQAHKVQKCSIRQGFVVYKIEGLDDRNECEQLRNAQVFAQPLEETELLEGEFSISKMIGMNAVSNMRGVVLGKLKSVGQFGAADVFTLEDDFGNEILFPHARDVIISVDYDKKIILIDEIVFDEIKC